MANTATASTRKSVEQVRKEIEHGDILYKRVFSGPDGEKVLNDLKMRFLNRSSVAIKDGRVDEYRTMVNEGAREVLLFITKRIEGAQHGLDEGSA